MERSSACAWTRLASRSVSDWAKNVTAGIVVVVREGRAKPYFMKRATVRADRFRVSVRDRAGGPDPVGAPLRPDHG